MKKSPKNYIAKFNPDTKFKFRNNTITDDVNQEITDENYIQSILIPNLDKVVIGIIAIIILTIAIFNFSKTVN